MRRIRYLVTSIILGGILLPLTGVASDYIPANFGFTGDQLVAKIDRSSLGKTDVSLAVAYCQSDIDRAGTAQRIGCYDSSAIQGLSLATERAIKSLSFTPAQVAREAVPVRMRFRIAYLISEQRISAELIPNLGSMQAQYGRDYIAPQERLDVSDWYARYSRHSLINGDDFMGAGDIAQVVATVKPDGSPEVVRALKTDPAYKRDANIVKNFLKRSRFIPGFVKGKPVPMGYMAIVNYDAPTGSSYADQ